MGWPGLGIGDGTSRDSWGARRCCRVTLTHTAHLITSHMYYILLPTAVTSPIDPAVTAGRQAGSVPSVRSGNIEESGNTVGPGNTEKFQSHHGFSRASNRIELEKVSFRIQQSRGTNRLELAEER